MHAVSEPLSKRNNDRVALHRIPSQQRSYVRGWTYKAEGFETKGLGSHPVSHALLGYELLVI